jgi:urease accessory protein
MMYAPSAIPPDVHSLGALAPELARFQDEPRQMRSGAIGKAGFLRLGFERRGDRTILANLDRRIPYMAQRALYCDEEMPEMAHVFVITTTGTVLQGDRFALDITVGPGAHAHVTTQSATKIHSMDANYAAQTQSITLADDAYLEALPDPLIPHREARYISDTRISIAPTATLLLSDIVQPGRKHHRQDEMFGATVVSLATSVFRPPGQHLFNEKLIIEPARNKLRQVGVMNGFDVFANVLLCTPEDKAERVYERVASGVDIDGGVAFGVSRLPNGAGLIYKVVGRDTATVRAKVREFWAIARREATGRELRPEFLWR